MLEHADGGQKYSSLNDVAVQTVYIQKFWKNVTAKQQKLQ